MNRTLTIDQTAQWFRIANESEIDTPALLVFPERVKQNIQTAITMVGDINRLRPHVKTNKSSGAIKLMIAAGIEKFKCATIAEAELLGICGAKDVLMAYQPLGPKLKRFISLIKKFPDTNYSCLTDNLMAAREQADLFAASNLKVPVYVDLNLGMNRTGIIPGPAAIKLYKFLATTESIQAQGLHAYDGHIRDKDIETRTTRCNTAFRLVEEMNVELQREGFKIPSIVAGGSPTFPIHALRNNVECSPGTFIYWDKSYLNGCPEQSFLPAAVLITRIISLPEKGLICTDLGHKSVAAENEIDRRVFLPDEPGIEVLSQSEEHLVAKVNDDKNYAVEDLLYGIPFHVCPTVALYEKVITVEDGIARGEWRNEARDRKITI